MKIFGSEICELSLQNSVMLRVIYSLLIQSLIMLKLVAIGISKIGCMCQFGEFTLCMESQWNSARFWLGIISNSVLNQMQVVESENNALFLNLKIPSKKSRFCK
jgi:hypothetical protein